MNTQVERKTDSDQEWIENTIKENWNSTKVVIQGEIVRPSMFEAIIAWRDSERVGLLTYRKRGDKLEILTLNSVIMRAGIGSQLLESLEIEARRIGCKVITVSTTNDNTDALAFYQKQGFFISMIQINSIKKAREKKPTIPFTGLNGIPIRDEIVLTKNIETL